MKKFLLAATAATALVGIATPAAAQTNRVHYAEPVLGVTGSFEAPYDFGDVAGMLIGEAAIANGIGTRYTVKAGAPGNTGTIGNVSVAFNLTGSVSKDCSFYSGNSGARDIDFGVIGIRGGNNENVNDAFEMVGPAKAEIETLTAGCNFNNTVKIAKDDVEGLVNDAPGGYDEDEFQANIRYEVKARWTGVAVNDVASGTAQVLNVAHTQLENQIDQGAWRSPMAIDIVTEKPNKGLVAGTYSGKTTLTLTAL